MSPVVELILGFSVVVSLSVSLSRFFATQFASRPTLHDAVKGGLVGLLVWPAKGLTVLLLNAGIFAGNTVWWAEYVLSIGTMIILAIPYWIIVHRFEPRGEKVSVQ
jgi:hypothetical protein